MMVIDSETAKITNYGCPVTLTTDVIGGKWKGVILYHLTAGARRFNEIRKLVPNVTQRILTLQLRELERDGIIHREVYNEIPARVDYSITPLGETLIPIIYQMRDWGDKYRAEIQLNRN